MDALRLLKAQHAEVRELFGRYENAKDSSERKAQLEKLAVALAAHFAIEERIFYPSVGMLGAGLEEAVQEHATTKRDVAGLLEMSPSNAQFDSMVLAVWEDIERHIREEEAELFPKVGAEIPERELAALGEEMLALFQELITETPPPGEKLQEPR